MTDLIMRNVCLDNRRTSMRLSKFFWDSLTAIATAEGLTLTQIQTAIGQNKPEKRSHTEAVRTFVAAYFILAQGRPSDRLLSAIGIDLYDLALKEAGPVLDLLRKDHAPLPAPPPG